MFRTYLLPRKSNLRLISSMLALFLPCTVVHASAVADFSTYKLTDFTPPQLQFRMSDLSFLDPYPQNFATLFSQQKNFDLTTCWRDFATEEETAPERFFDDDYYGTRAFPEPGYSLRISPEFSLQGGFDILTEQNALWYMRESGVDDYSMHFNGVKAMLGVAIAPRQTFTVRAGVIGNINSDLPVDTADPQQRRIRDNASDLVGFLNADWLF